MKSNFVPDSNTAAESRAKEESTNYIYMLFFYKANDANQSEYSVFDPNGTKKIGFLRKATGSNQHSFLLLSSTLCTKYFFFVKYFYYLFFTGVTRIIFQFRTHSFVTSVYSCYFY